MKVEHETFEGRVLEAQSKMNTWLAQNPGARVLNVETLTMEQSQSPAAMNMRKEIGLRMWFTLNPTN